MLETQATAFKPRFNARRHASLVAMLIASTIATVHAQESQPAPQADASTDKDPAKVVVTGSRIRGVAPIGSSVIQMGIEDIKRSGAVTTAELLQEVPQITSLGFNSEGSLGPAAPQNITRSTAPNLRGIGPQATLTLLDGQRMPTSGTMGNIADPSYLPPLAVQRIEVIADGASAVYGSDAIAGVVNLIPRKKFTGAETMARVGFADGYKDQQAGAIFGTEWTGGSGVLAFDFSHNTLLSMTDRDFVSPDRRRFGGADGRSLACAPGTASLGGATYALPSGNGQGVVLSSLTPGSSNRCNVNQFDTLIPESSRGNVYGYAEQKISDTAKLYVQGLYFDRQSRSTRQQYAISNYTVPRTNAFYPADELANPASLVVNYSFLDPLGPDAADVSNKVFQVLTGLDGDLGKFHYKLTASTGQGQDEEDNTNALSQFAIAQAIASSNPNTALNVFGGPGANSAAVLRQLNTGHSIIEGTAKLDTVSAGIDGPVFGMPAGEARIAIGSEMRRDSLDSFGLNTNTSRTSTIPVIKNSSSSRDIKAVYSELYVPVVSANNSVSGIQKLDLSLAGRWEKYSDVGSTSNPKVGVNWTPISGLMAHASYGTSFRAPSLTEMDPNSSGAGIYQSTTNVPGRGLVSSVALAGGDSNIKPEKATTRSFGVDLAPSSLRDLKIGLTYFDINYRDEIVDGFGYIAQYLADPVTYASNVAYPGSANYNQIKNLIESSSFATPGAINYTGVAVVDARKRNLGAVNVNGLDLQASNIWRTDIGNITLRANMTHYLKYDEAANGTLFIDRDNEISYPARNSGRLSAAWAQDGWSAQLTGNYTGAYRNQLSVLLPRVDSYTTFDADLAYRFEGEGFRDGVRIALNIKNLTDKAPPVVDLNYGYDPSKASALGRTIALTATKSW